MAEVNPETGVTSGSRSPRFTLWVSFFAFSVITLGSSVGEKNNSYTQERDVISKQRWAVACSAITFSISFIMVVAQLHPVSSVFVVGTKLEGIICLILLGFWSATVAVVTSAGNGLAVNEVGEVNNGNLYYFSWAGFVCSVVLAVSYLRGIFGVDVAGELKSRSARLTSWSAFLATSLIVLGACANLFDQNCSRGDQTETNEYCRRAKYGIAIGATGGFFAFCIVGIKIMTTAAAFVIEGAMALLLLILFAIGVALLTSANMPGAPLGNLYYFCWISLILTVVLLANCVEELKGSRTRHPHSERSEDKISNGNVPLDSIDDSI